ncbi:MAG: hypothetical protein AAF430_23260 [Myxococcota bacterium]
MRSIVHTSWRRGQVLVLAVAGLLMLGNSCASAPGEPTPLPASLTACEDPRPEACTHDYRPACGHRCAAPPCTAAQRKTYGNACSACSDSAVMAVEPGRCEDGAAPSAPLLR